MSYKTYTINSGLKKAKRKISTVVAGVTAFAVPAVVALSGGAALAATTYSLFGDATLVSGGNLGRAAQIRSIEPGGFGGVSLSSTTVTDLNSLTNLATDYKFTENSCGGGSPRFQVRVSNDGGVTNKNIFVYIGPAPSYTGCPMGVWTASGNLVTPASLVDTSQLPGGTFYDPYSAALVKYGNYTVTGISFVADGEWAFAGNQTVLADNVEINTDKVTFDQPLDKDECKKDGWMNLTDQNGDPFKNQGQCVSWTNGRGQ